LLLLLLLLLDRTFVGDRRGGEHVRWLSGRAGVDWDLEREGVGVGVGVEEPSRFMGDFRAFKE